MEEVSEFGLAFEKDGFVVLRSVAEDVNIAACHDEALNIWRQRLEACNGSMSLGQRGGYKQIVQRHAGRYEVRLAKEETHHLDILKETLLARLPFRVAKASLGADVAVCATSVVIADESCAAQTWHVDGAHLSLANHEPCHCLNIFFPLVDLTKSSGTELRPGSHFLTRNMAKQLLLAKAKKTLRPTLTPSLALGDCLLFDYRLLYRGLANTLKKPRPVFVLTLSKPWFKDILNFPSRSLFPDTNNFDNKELTNNEKTPNDIEEIIVVNDQQ